MLRTFHNEQNWCCQRFKLRIHCQMLLDWLRTLGNWLIWSQSSWLPIHFLRDRRIKSWLGPAEWWLVYLLWCAELCTRSRRLKLYSGHYRCNRHARTYTRLEHLSWESVGRSWCAFFGRHATWLRFVPVHRCSFLITSCHCIQLSWDIHMRGVDWDELSRVSRRQQRCYKCRVCGTFDALRQPRHPATRNNMSQSASILTRKAHAEPPCTASIFLQHRQSMW